MTYKEFIKQENESADERYQLAMDRLAAISAEKNIEEPFVTFFNTTSAFIIYINELYKSVETKEANHFDIEQLKSINKILFEDINPKKYEISYANPDYATKVLGQEYGSLLCYLYTKMRDMIYFVYLQRKMYITLYSELFLEIYHIFEDKELTSFNAVRNSIYWFEKDNTDIFISNRIKEIIDPKMSFATEIVMKSDLEDLRYLYQYGEYVGENELGIAAYLNTLSQEEIDRLAEVYTEGYRLGFMNTNKDLSKKSAVDIRYNIGFERIVRSAISKFEVMGLEPVIYRGGYQSTKVNRQYWYDHKFDEALYYDKGYIKRRLEVERETFEEYKEIAAKMGGPAVIEIFGEEPFEPENKKSAYKFSQEQQKLHSEYRREYGRIVNQYIIGDERSFTIIAFPIPEIGSDFEEVFKETVKINSLDQKIYEEIQQKIIDILDQAEYVRVIGKEANKTYLTISMNELTDKDKQTNFENCLADVNIPLGEVFTSPKLEGTNGILHVSQVYLNDMKYKDLEITFKDGCVDKYTCKNFDEEEENKRFIKENLLFNHETLPIGEFAIGTNTTAYVMANKYDIVYKLPILIVEKMGPHFAIGDTCFSWEEEVKTYNPNGKEIAAKDNEISILRKEDVSKAYFNCHTDITIPYDELGEITAVTKEGEELPIIKNGRFILEGTELLNEAFKTK